MEKFKNVAPMEDFNWDAYENGAAETSLSKEELEKAYDGTLNNVNSSEVVDGKVISMNKREVVVNIGYKSDGIIPLSEFRYNPELAIGDTVEVFIENQEDKKGQLILSHKKARAARSWDRVNAALENEEIIKGYIKCRTKGPRPCRSRGATASPSARARRCGSGPSARSPSSRPARAPSSGRTGPSPRRCRSRSASPRGGCRTAQGAGRTSCRRRPRCGPRSSPPGTAPRHRPPPSGSR